jgi:Mn-dependent DtxR family transcriptional regulator
VIPAANVRAQVLRALAWLGASTVPEVAASRMLAHVRPPRVRDAVKALTAEGLVEPAGVGDRNARCYRLTDAGTARVKEL